MKKIVTLIMVFLMFLSVFSGVYADNTTNNANNTFVGNEVTNSQNSSVMYVSTNGNDENDGLTVEKSKKKVQSAIDSVTENGTVRIGDGIYHENLKINKKVSLVNYERSIINPVIIDGDFKDNTMVIGKNGDVHLERIILKHGLGIGLINNGKVDLHFHGVMDNTIENVAGIVNNGEMILRNVEVKNNSNSGIINNGNLYILYHSYVIDSSNGVINKGNLTIYSGSAVLNNKENGVISYGNLSIAYRSVISDNGNNGIISYGNLTITNSSISNNRDMGVYVTGTSNITCSNIQYNNLGVNNEGKITITDSSINLNKIKRGNWGFGVAGIRNTGILHIINSQIQNNDGDYQGEVISNEGISTITDSIISHNIGNSGITNQNVLNITNSIIHANTIHGNGGIENRGVLNVVKCRITNNIGGMGGGIFNFDSAVIVNSTIKNNKVISKGGGIYSYGFLAIINSTVSNNKAKWSTYIFSLTDNDHETCGGGIYAKGILKIINCKITGNKAWEGGGVYHIGSNVYTTIVNSEITGNKALRGGGIYHEGNLVLDGVKVKDNFALRGGGIYNTNGDIFKEGNTEITGNLLKNIYKKYYKKRSSIHSFHIFGKSLQQSKNQHPYSFSHPDPHNKKNVSFNIMCNTSGIDFNHFFSDKTVPFNI